MSDAPTLRALVLCALAFQDKRNRWNLIGIADTFNVVGAPATFNSITVYVRIADVPLKGVLRLDVRDAGGNLAASSGQKAYTSTDRTKDLQAVIEITNVTFPVIGQYFAEVYINNILTGSWPISVEVGVRCP